jgi:hypothetical protein
MADEKKKADKMHPPDGRTPNERRQRKRHAMRQVIHAGEEIPRRGMSII